MMQTTATSLVDRLRSLIAEWGLPAVAEDGDCIPVTNRLVSALPGATSIDVVGWMDFHGSRVMAFAHKAAIFEGQVVDLTATQFDPSLPMPWVASPEEYTRRLMTATRVQSVEIDPFRKTAASRGTMVRGFTLELSPAVGEQFLAALNGGLENQAAEIVARWAEGSQGGYHTGPGVGVWWAKGDAGSSTGIDRLYGAGGNLDYANGVWRFQTPHRPHLGVMLEAEQPVWTEWDSHNRLKPETSVLLRKVRVYYYENFANGQWLDLPAPMVRVTATRPANDYEQGPFRKVVAWEPTTPTARGHERLIERLECGHEGEYVLKRDHEKALRDKAEYGDTIKGIGPKTKRRCWGCSGWLADIQRRQASLKETTFGQYRLTYRTKDEGERKERQIITAWDGDLKVGELNWYGTTGTIHHVWVEDEYARRGIATAMWEWGQTMKPPPKHSGDRTTQGDAWARSVGGPIPRHQAAATSLYRGIRVEVALSAIVDKGFGRAVEDALVASEKQMGIGVHWSRSREVAERFARVSASSRDDVPFWVSDDGRGAVVVTMPVVLEGKPRMADLLDDEARARGVMYLVIDNSDEDEVPVVYGSQVPVERAWVLAPNDDAFTRQWNRYRRVGNVESRVGPLSWREQRLGITMRANIEPSWFDQSRREHPDWPVIDGVIYSPDSTGQWRETHGVWVYKDSTSFPCLRAVAPQGDSWAWEVLVPVGFGPNSGKILSGTAKTLDAAKEKAMSATKRDEEVNGRYLQRQKEIFSTASTDSPAALVAMRPEMAYDDYERRAVALYQRLGLPEIPRSTPTGFWDGPMFTIRNTSKRTSNGRDAVSYRVETKGGETVATCYNFPEARRAYAVAVIEAMAGTSHTASTKHFFHGSDADLMVGDVLVPGKEIGKDNWDREEFSEDFVWMLDSPEYASVYGKHLYEVEPIGEVMNFSEEAGASRTTQGDGIASKTATQQPPAGLTFVEESMPQWFRCVKAIIDGEEVGRLCWQAVFQPMHPIGEIASIDVAHRWRRHGIATALFDYVKAIEPRLHHSNALSDDGRAWRQSFASSKWSEQMAVVRGEEERAESLVPLQGSGRRKYRHDGLGVQWFLPGKKRPIGTTTRATSDLVALLADDGLTFAQAIEAIHYDEDALEILHRFVDAGYGDTRMSDLGVRYARKVSAASKPTVLHGSMSSNCQVIYYRSQDAFAFFPVGEGMAQAPPWSEGHSGMSDGFVFRVESGEIMPEGGYNMPVTPTMFNPLAIEALERLMDLDPSVGRMTLLDSAPHKGSYPMYRGTVWDFLRSVNEIRSDFAGHTAGITSMELFHGTCGLYADKILSSGLKPRDTTGVPNPWSEKAISRPGMVYLSHPSRLTMSRASMMAAVVAAKEQLGYESRSSELSNQYRRTEDEKVRELIKKKQEALRSEMEADRRLDPVLLRVRIPFSEFHRFRPDEDTEPYTDAVSAVTGMPEWMSSIGSQAVVAFAGDIPPSWITVADRGRSAMQAGMYDEEQGNWRMNRSAAIPRLYRSWGERESQYRESEPRLFIHVKDLSQGEAWSPYVLTDRQVPWNADLHQSVQELIRQAKREYPAFPVKIKDPLFILWGGGKLDSQSKVIATSKDLKTWSRPSQSSYRSVGDSSYVLNEVIFGSADKDQAWKTWLTEVVNMSPPGDPTHPGIKDSDTKITVYRGISIGVGDDPLSGKVWSASPSEYMGSSWSSSLDVAKAIAERGGAGFNFDNSPGKPVSVKPGKGPNNRSFDHPSDRSIPVVLRAEVVLGENASLYEGLGGYRYLTAEREVDIPPGTEFTLTGWMQADEIPVDPSAAKRAWDLYAQDEAQRKKEKRSGGYDSDYWKPRYEHSQDDWYEVTYRWGRWHDVKVTRRAALQ